LSGNKLKAEEETKPEWESTRRKSLGKCHARMSDMTMQAVQKEEKDPKGDTKTQLRTKWC
jgi:hypothetical protein